MVAIELFRPRADVAALRPFGLASIALFAFGAVAGGLAIVFYPEAAAQLQELLRQFATMFQGMSKVQLVISIFLNNSLKTLLVILLGPALGLAAVVFLVVNGAILGAVIPLAIESRGFWPAIMTIIPHGVFELPAIFMGTSIGIKLGVHPLRALTGKADRTLAAELGRALRLYLSLILPLLLVAAIVEVFVTPLLAGL